MLGTSQCIERVITFPHNKSVSDVEQASENGKPDERGGFGIKYGTTEGQKNDVVFEIEDLKKKTERAASFFPLWADDECLQHLRDKTHRTMRSGQQDKGETDQKKMSKEADDNEKNKTELKRASLNHLIVEGTYRDSIRSYVLA